MCPPQLLRLEPLEPAARSRGPQPAKGAQGSMRRRSASEPLVSSLAPAPGVRVSHEAEAAADAAGAGRGWCSQRLQRFSSTDLK